MCCLLRYVDTKTMESVNDSDTMEDMITFGQWSLQVDKFRNPNKKIHIPRKILPLGYQALKMKTLI